MALLAVVILRERLHWDWVCDRLDRRQLAALRRYTLGQLAVVNAQPFPAPAAVLA